MSTDASGRLFELLIAYLVRSLGGFDSRGRVRSLDSETDLILRNDRMNPAVLGDYILVECKNWAKPVGAPDVKKFAQNVRAAGCHSGIIATKSGLTGGSAEEIRDAKYTIRRHYHRDEIVLLTVDLDDVRGLVSRRVSLHDLLVAKYESIRFDEREV